MGTIKLNGITWDHARGFDPLIAASKIYLADFGVRICWNKRTLKDFGDQSLPHLAGEYDLLIMDHPHCGIAADTQCVLPLEKFLSKSEFKILRHETAGPSFDSYHYLGHQWALPIDAAMQCAAYRADLHPGPLPKTWNEVLKIEKMGMALCPTDSLCSFLSISAQLGVAIKEENEFLISEEKGLRVLELLKLLKSNAHPQSISWNPIQLLDHMTQQSDIAYTPLVFGYTNYSRDGYRKERLHFSEAPNICNTVLGGAGIAVSAHCQYKQAACAFASWICSSEVQKSIYVNAGGQPGNMAAWNSQHANIITNHFFASTKKTLEAAYVRPRFKTWPKFQEYLGHVLHECLLKNQDNKTVIQHLNQAFAKLEK